MAKVFLDYDQQALDAAYDQAMYAPNRDQLLARFARASELARQRLGAAERFAYGESAIEGLDLYRTKATNAPINVFVHGGAWRAGLARDYAFPAETLVRAGAHYVALDFNNVIETGGRLMSNAGPGPGGSGLGFVASQTNLRVTEPARSFTKSTC